MICSRCSSEDTAVKNPSNPSVVQCYDCGFYWNPDYGEKTNMIRYATVRGYSITTEKVAAYLPSNYQIVGLATANEPWGDSYQVVVISGRDNHGWTLDGYVIPRLGSGNMAATEIDLSHPIMSQFDM